MDLDKNNTEELKKKLDGVIEKSEIQKKLLNKILTELNKQNDVGKEGDSFSNFKQND